MLTQFHDLLIQSTLKYPKKVALELKDQVLTYQNLQQKTNQFAQQINKLSLKEGTRIGVYLPKQFEAVISYFGTSQSHNVFVPINSLLKGEQVDYILDNCDIKVLVTSLSRYQQLQTFFDNNKNLEHIILTDCSTEETPKHCICWNEQIDNSPIINSSSELKRNKNDIVAILYTSGSTGNPKGVVLSHNNLLYGAKSVASYLENTQQDKLLAVLPFSFDYGLSQITTAFLVGASVVLMEYLLPRDVIKTVVKYKITGLAAVPPLWIQLADLEWPDEAKNCLRYWTNSGGAMPQATLKKLQNQLPNTLPFLMYGLTEAFRSTYLPPKEINKRPTSIGKAIPDATILVVNSDGNETKDNEEGELVHYGPHVSLGYWNAPEKTAIRFKPLPDKLASKYGFDLAVWSGDTVTKDSEGFLYFVGRKDDMIKSSGYRISPSEIEDLIYQHESVAEVAAIGIKHDTLGQAIVLIIKPSNIEQFDSASLLKYCQKKLPNFMQPKSIQIKNSLPRNPNGKINRKALSIEFFNLFVD